MAKNPRDHAVPWTFFKKEVGPKEMKKYPSKLGKREEVPDEGK